MTIPLASLYLSTILILDLLFLYNYTTIFHNVIDGMIPSSVMSADLGILGGLFQPTLPSQSLLNSVGSLLSINEFNISYSFIPSFQDNLLTTAVIVYSNAETDKSRILSENKGKAGVYQWKHNDSDKIYIGSAVKLCKRLSRYYTKSYLNSNKTMHICNALLHHGHSSFSLSILEFINTSNLSKEDTRKLILLTEQKYLDLIFKEAKEINTYNILPTADSRLGALHSKETKALISKAMTEAMTDERKAKISKALTGQNNPMYNKNHSTETLDKMRGRLTSEFTKNLHKINRTGTIQSEETRLKMRISHGGVVIICSNIENREEIIYSSKSEAALALECSIRTVSRRCEDNAIYRFKGNSYKLSYKNI